MKRLSLILMVAAGLGMASCEKVKQVADFNNLGIGNSLCSGITASTSDDWNASSNVIDRYTNEFAMLLNGNRW